MLVAKFEQDNLRYTFEPPVEVGDRKVGSIHEIAAIALLGSEASEDDIDTAMHCFSETIQTESYDRVKAFNTFLETKHTVTAKQIEPGMPTWRHTPPFKGKVPGLSLSPENSARLKEALEEIDRATMAVRGNDLIVYSPGYKTGH